MSKFKKLIAELFSTDNNKISFLSDYPESLLYSDNNYTISISKTYKGYDCEIVCWMNSNFGKKNTLKSTKQIDIINFIKDKIN